VTAGNLTPKPGRGGLPRLTLRHAGGAQCELYPHGAHVTSYVTAAGRDLLYLSERAIFRDGAAIRGGIPVIFPQFGPGPLPRHGFARTTSWELVDGEGRGDAPWAQLRLRDSDATRALWPHAFEATLTVRLGADALRVELGVENRGDAALSFTGALHSYLRVGDVERAAVEGLAGRRYLDQLSGASDVAQDDARVTFAGAVDRVYADVPRVLTVQDAAESRAVRVTLDGFADAVVWNPGEDAGTAIDDLDPSGWRRFVCVEGAAAARPVTVAAGARWSGSQTLAAVRPDGGGVPNET
jgi:glucose-6-phosphate 1-epimerase